MAWGAKNRPHRGQGCSSTWVCQVWRIRTGPLSSTRMAPVGQISAQAPQPRQASLCSSKGVPTLRLPPRPTKPMAQAPMASWQTLTQRPHSTHSSISPSGGETGKRDSLTPIAAANFLITSDCEARLRRNSTARRRAVTASGVSVFTTMPSSAGWTQAATSFEGGGLDRLTIHSRQAP